MNRRYLSAIHSDKHLQEFLPTRWRQKSTGIDKEKITSLSRYVFSLHCDDVVIRRTLIIIIIIVIFLAHQHKACRQLKIKQEMTAVGD